MPIINRLASLIPTSLCLKKAFFSVKKISNKIEKESVKMKILSLKRFNVINENIME